MSGGPRRQSNRTHGRMMMVMMQGTSLNDVIAVQTNHLSAVVDEHLDRHLAAVRSDEPVTRM